MAGQTRLVTLGEIALQLGLPLSRAEYLVRRTGVKPTRRFGFTRVFTLDDLEVLRSAAGRMACKRAGKGRPARLSPPTPHFRLLRPKENDP
jgi:hypothetical protein